MSARRFHSRGARISSSSCSTQLATCLSRHSEEIEHSQRSVPTLCLPQRDWLRIEAMQGFGPHVLLYVREQTHLILCARC